MLNHTQQEVVNFCELISSWGLRKLPLELKDCLHNCGVSTTVEFLQNSINSLTRPLKKDAKAVLVEVNGCLTLETMQGLRLIIYYSKYRYDKEVAMSTVRANDNLIASMCNAQHGTYLMILAEKGIIEKKFVRSWFKHRSSFSNNE